MHASFLDAAYSTAAHAPLVLAELPLDVVLLCGTDDCAQKAQLMLALAQTAKQFAPSCGQLRHLAYEMASGICHRSDWAAVLDPPENDGASPRRKAARYRLFIRNAARARLPNERAFRDMWHAVTVGNAPDKLARVLVRVPFAAAAARFKRLGGRRNGVHDAAQASPDSCVGFATNRKRPRCELYVCYPEKSAVPYDADTLEAHPAPLPQTAVKGQYVSLIDMLRELRTPRGEPDSNSLRRAVPANLAAAFLAPLAVPRQPAWRPPEEFFFEDGRTWVKDGRAALGFVYAPTECWKPCQPEHSRQLASMLCSAACSPGQLVLSQRAKQPVYVALRQPLVQINVNTQYVRRLKSWRHPARCPEHITGHLLSEIARLA